MVGEVVSLGGIPLLLRLGVAPQYECKRQPLQLHEEETPAYFINKNGVISKVYAQQHYWMKPFDSRFGDGRTHAARFVRRPSVFVVTDDL